VGLDSVAGKEKIMTVDRYISADSHVLEPDNLWLERMDTPFRARAPRVVHNPPGFEGDYWLFGDREPVTAVQGFFAGASRKSYDEITEHLKTARYAERLPGSYDPAARLKDMDLDGTAAEVLYPTYPLGLMSVTDGPLQRELFRVYNDWLAQYCAAAPERLVGLGLISVWDVEMAVGEVQRCAAMGLKGGMIVSYPPEGYGYEQRRYDPLWAAAQELGMPISLHAFTGHGIEDDSRYPRLRHSCLHHAAQRSLTQMIYYGVFDRFPGLKIVLAEFDIGWVPHFLWLADDKYRMRHENPAITPKMPPSAYFTANVYASFIDDPIGLKNTDIIGADNYMWSNDYPHWESSWPRSRDYIARNFQGVADEVRRKITWENVKTLYHIG
jgi:predicted TIM-barrel fold metal-dependent hydrolase